jgi:hypothetical protein
MRSTTCKEGNFGDLHAYCIKSFHLDDKCENVESNFCSRICDIFGDALAYSADEKFCHVPLYKEIP